jgi:Sulfotransferase domain
LASKVKGNLPSIFLVGGQKCGSSSLFELLTQHPLLLKVSRNSITGEWYPDPNNYLFYLTHCFSIQGIHKEPHFFDAESEYKQGLDYYKSHYFPPSKGSSDDNSGSQFIDGTPMLHKDYVWERISTNYGTARTALKFIVILREPVARDISWYQQVVREKILYGGLFADVKTMKETAIPAQLFSNKTRDKSAQGAFDKTFRGQYVDQIKAILKYFKRNQVFVLSTDMLVSNTTQVVQAILRFLRVPDNSSLHGALPHDDHTHAILKLGGQSLVDCVASHVPPTDCAFRDSLGAYYEPYNKKLYRFLRDTRSDADPNEPHFPASFASYKSLPCVKDAREKYNSIMKNSDDVATAAAAAAASAAGATSSSGTSKTKSGGVSVPNVGIDMSVIDQEATSDEPLASAAGASAAEAAAASKSKSKSASSTIATVTARSLHTYGKEKERTGNPAAGKGCVVAT